MKIFIYLYIYLIIFLQQISSDFHNLAIGPFFS